MTALSRLLDQVRSAVDRSQPLCIVGGNSKQYLGREPVGAPIHLSGYAGVVEYQPTELVITVRAGTTIGELNETLAEEHQMLASESPELDKRATIGGTLACNQSGPSRPWSGSIRDHVLGVRLINGNAEQLCFGGQVMKNVAGYDVSRLQAGAMGTLGVLTEISLKVLPRPRSSVTLVRPIDAAAAIRAMNEIAVSPEPVTGACWLDGNLYLRFSGLESAVEAAAVRCAGEKLIDDAAFWKGLREQTLPFFACAEHLWRFSLKSTAAHALPESSWLIDWGGAQRWLAGRHDREVLENMATAAGGELSWIRGGRRSAEVFPTRAEAYRRLMLRTKQAFDPAGIFNPGRLYSWM